MRRQGKGSRERGRGRGRCGGRRDVLAFLFLRSPFFGFLPPAAKRIFQNMHIMNWQSKGRESRGAEGRSSRCKGEEGGGRWANCSQFQWPNKQIACQAAVQPQPLSENNYLT